MNGHASVYTEPLTHREVDILHCLVDGLSNNEIADRLCLAPSTIKWYIRQLNSKLRTENREAIIERVFELGLLGLPAQSILPRSTTPFVGRKVELDELYNILAEPDIRLLTILAPGGMGKTRLALEAAAQQIPNFHDGVYLVPLHMLSEAVQLVPAIASAIGFQLQGHQRPEQQLLRYLGNKEMLLLFDSCEVLPESTSLIADLMQAAPAIKVLVTSREKLNLLQESVYTLHGLRFPDGVLTEDALQYDAVQLLIQTAKRVKPDWIPTRSNLFDAARICKLTGGMPLGILLAASWLDILSLEEIAAEIQKNTDILETELLDVPERQRSIRAVFNYAWQRLTPDEQTAYARLSVFRGGFTREAAEQITGVSLRGLLCLRNKALLQLQQTGRFDIHDLLHQYGQEQLAADPDENTRIHKAHATYYAEMLRRHDDNLKGSRQSDALNEIEANLENIRAAWQWNLEHLRLPALEAMRWSVQWYYIMKGFMLAGKEFFEGAIKTLAPLPQAHVVYQKICVPYGWCCCDIQETQKGMEILEHALALARERGDLSEAAYALHVLAIFVTPPEKAMVLIEESVQIFRALNDLWWLSVALNLKGYLMRLVHTPLSEQIGLLEEVLMIRREIDDKIGIMATLNNAGTMWFDFGDPDRAKAYYEECQSLRRELNLSQTVAYMVTLYNLAGCYLHWSDFEQAEHSLREALAIADRLQLDACHFVPCYKWLALLAGFSGDREHYHAYLTQAREWEKISKLPLLLERLWAQRQFRIFEGSVAWCWHDYDTARAIFSRLLRELKESSMEEGFHAQVVRINLCLLDLEQGIKEPAQKRLISLLHEAMKAEKVRGWYLSILYGFALIARMEASLSRAVELVALVRHHKATSYDVRVRAVELLAGLQGELPPHEFWAAEERGKFSDLDRVVQQMSKKTD